MIFCGLHFFKTFIKYAPKELLKKCKDFFLETIYPVRGFKLQISYPEYISEADNYKELMKFLDYMRPPYSKIHAELPQVGLDGKFVSNVTMAKAVLNRVNEICGRLPAAYVLNLSDQQKDIIGFHTQDSAILTLTKFTQALASQGISRDIYISHSALKTWDTWNALTNPRAIHVYYNLDENKKYAGADGTTNSLIIKGRAKRTGAKCVCDEVGIEPSNQYDNIHWESMPCYNIIRGLVADAGDEFGDFDWWPLIMQTNDFGESAGIMSCAPDGSNPHINRVFMEFVKPNNG